MKSFPAIRTRRLCLAMIALFSTVASVTSKTVSEGISEFMGHYANLLQGGKERPPTRLKIAIVGLPRTGTGSLFEALNLLDYTTVHADEYLEISDLFADLADGTSMDTFTTKVGERGFDAMYFWSYDFVKWAAETRDDNVKVILTVRDTPEKWAKSWSSVGSSWDALWFSRPFIWFTPVAQMAPILSKLFQDIQPTTESGALEQTYTDHIHRIQKTVRKDKLLVFNAKQGWEPLCQFLGHPVPQVPFPHANERVLLQIENYMVWIITWIWPVFPLSCLSLLWKLTVSLLLLIKKTKKLSHEATKKQC